jgi:putative transposase
MPRLPRLQVPGGLYHVTAHSNHGRLAFADDGERAWFLWLLGELVARRGWSCRSYCVLSTHYHLLCLTPQPDLALGMQYLNGRYGQWANWRRTQRGHVFEGRYKAVLVQTEAHALEVHRYIALNPVRAGLVRRPEDWPWSAYGALVGKRRPLPQLDVNPVYADFGPSVASARRRLRTFVEDGLAQDAA